MGTMDRLILCDQQWERIAQHIIGNERTRGSSGRDNRMFVEGVLWIVRRLAVARSAGDVRLFEQRLSSLQSVERQGRVAPHFRGDGGRSGL